MKALVVTSIHPAENVLSQYLNRGYEMIIVGDKKSPRSYDLDCEFLDTDRQLKEFPRFASALPFNHYARKNLGYLHALARGATSIAEIDDDITPLGNWQAPPANSVDVITSPRWPNVIELFTDSSSMAVQRGSPWMRRIWARGFPLDEIRESQMPIYGDPVAASSVWVWQNWTEGAPDLDAVCRLIFDPSPTFVPRAPVALRGAYAPFNSQNTVWTTTEAMAFAYLPALVSFRYTDILRSYVAQRAINAAGGLVGYSQSDTYSDRNPHDVLDDLRQETEMYSSTHRTEAVLDKVRWLGDRDDLIRAYEGLADGGLVDRGEVTMARLWLSEFSNLVK